MAEQHGIARRCTSQLPILSQRESVTATNCSNGYGAVWQSCQLSRPLNV